MPKKIITVPEIDFFHSKFNFIDNLILKDNLSISYQYIIFLIKVESEFSVTGAVEYSIFKNIIQYAASIVESTMNYGLEQLIIQRVVRPEDVMPKMETFREKKELYKIDEFTAILGVKRVFKSEKFKKNTQFKTICDCYEKGRLFEEKLLKDVNELREKRNKIHLAGLKQVENYYSKEDINKSFETASLVISNVKKLLENSSNNE